MKRVIASVLLIGLSTIAVAGEASWPSFRGRNAAGTGIGAMPPTGFDVPKRQNVLWRTPVPGLGHSSPIVHGDRVFVTTAVRGKGEDRLKVGLYGDIDSVADDSPHEWRVLAFDRRTGELLWERTAHSGVPKIARHTKASHANSTPATDGKRVIAFFGSEGLYAYDLNGKLLWKRDLGVLDSGYFEVPEAQWGFGSSPVIDDGRVIVQCDVQGGGFVAAFDANDGREIWRTARKDVPTWSTPAIVEHRGRKQVVVNGWHRIAGYDFATGKELWHMSGGGDIPVPTPIFAHDLVFITNAHGSQAPIYAVRPSATGEITLVGEATSNDQIAWASLRGGAYMQTPIVVGNELFVCRDNGALTCLDASTGREIWKERLGSGNSGFTASAVAAGDRLYYTSEEGTVYTIRAGTKFELLATSDLAEVAMATPAIANGALFFRTRGHLVAIAEKPAARTPAAAVTAPPS